MLIQAHPPLHKIHPARDGSTIRVIAEVVAGVAEAAAIVVGIAAGAVVGIRVEETAEVGTAVEGIVEAGNPGVCHVKSI